MRRSKFFKIWLVLSVYAISLASGPGSAHAINKVGRTTNQLGGGGGKGGCENTPQITGTLPGLQIETSANRVSIGLLGRNFDSRMSLVGTVSGEQAEIIPFSITSDPQSLENVVRATLNSERSNSITLQLLVESGQGLCRSNEVTIEIHRNQSCNNPCGFPFTEGCSGDVVYIDDSWLDPDGLAAMVGTGAVAAATNKVHHLALVIYGAAYANGYSSFLHHHIGLAAQSLTLLYGISPSIIRDAWTNRAGTTLDLANLIANATPCNPLYILMGGPFEILFDALTIAQSINPEGSNYTKYLTHSPWNDTRGYPNRSTVTQIFSQVEGIEVADGNEYGFNTPNGMDFMNSPLLEPIRQQAAIASTISPWVATDYSDTTMIYTLFTGIPFPYLHLIRATLGPLM